MGFTVFNNKISLHSTWFLNNSHMQPLENAINYMNYLDLIV